MADKILTAEEYLSEQRWPLSTQIDPHRLDLNGQLMIDAVNFDSLKEGIELGEHLDEQQLAKMAELEEKLKYAPALRKQVAEEMKAKRRAREAAKSS